MEIKLFFKKGPTIKFAKPKKSPRKIGRPNIAIGIKNLNSHQMLMTGLSNMYLKGRNLCQINSQ